MVQGLHLKAMILATATYSLIWQPSNTLHPYNYFCFDSLTRTTW